MLKTRITAAVIQMSSGENKDANLDRALRLADRAAKKGAEVVLLPEAFLYRGKNVLEKGVAVPINGPTVKRFCVLAKERRMYVLLGSIYEKVPGSAKVYNTAVLVGPGGRIEGTYRKQHLFEARVSGRTIREADIFLPGKRQKIFSIGSFLAGGAICYDVRFPEIFHQYARRGCEMFLIPSNFTYETGRAHWEILLRSRAIENKCYVLAANQHGTDSAGVRSYGNSMIIDPWGNIEQRAGANGDDVLVCVIDKKEIFNVRKRLL